ncbi:CYTH domain-containing protein [Shewanella corallii]|uniref:CYTH domain-containing protein n=1 Tax=Shewanella corallii TaxID=560080 RepID=A0ABT0N621_9GAMM|nr:CYTH domain-containing protein [Shewanella corallii]MCL2913888.1 CYTH domain-containing protein [Shewanella corallii]
MAAEIELKLFLDLADLQTLTTKLSNLEHSELLPTKQLTNRYFDTQDLQLRRWDMGLRVRGEGDHREQTIKTAGRVAGGIHSRPEYNIDIEADTPTLSLFPDEIWPVDADIATVQNELYCLFDTNFTRQLWHVYVGNSMVEIALDTGTIVASGEREEICELEFELLAGEVSALIELATQVAEWIPVRLGKASKAQRGYRLASQSSPLSLEALKYVELTKDSDINIAVQTLLETCVERWQLLEQMIAESAHVPLQCVELWQRLRSIIRLQRLTLQQFGLWEAGYDSGFELLEANLGFVDKAQYAAGIIEESLASKHQQSDAFEAKAAAELTGFDFTAKLHSLQRMPQYGQLQLAMVRLLLDLQKGLVVLPQVSLKAMADKMQEASWQSILELMPPTQSLSDTDYLSAIEQLDEAILVGFAYGELYDAQSRDSFRAPWGDLVNGIRTLGSYNLLDEYSHQLELDLSDWLTNKKDSLLLALDFSRKSAQAMTPYWR